MDLKRIKKLEKSRIASRITKMPLSGLRKLEITRIPCDKDIFRPTKLMTLTLP